MGLRLRACRCRCWTGGWDVLDFQLDRDDERLGMMYAAGAGLAGISRLNTCEKHDFRMMNFVC